MLSLREMQMAFTSSVLGDDARCMEGLVLERGFSTEERFRIYRNNARIGFHQALHAAYPVIAQLGGAEWFESVARRYQLQHPSRHGDLQFVGAHFPQFLQSELSGSSYEWFTDVARLEWAYQEVLVAAESPSFDPGVLHSLTSTQQEHLIFVPRAALRLVESHIAVLDIWKAHQPDNVGRELSLDVADRHVLVSRRNDHVELCEIPASQALLLEQFQRGVPLHAAQTQLARHLPNADLGAALIGLVQRQALASIRIANH